MPKSNCAICGRLVGRSELTPLVSPLEEIVVPQEVTAAVADLAICTSCADLKARAHSSSAAMAQLLELAEAAADDAVRDFLGQAVIADQAQRQQAEEARRRTAGFVNIQVTSGFGFEGYTITDYRGFLSEETGVGLGIFGGIASFSSVSGAESESLRTKLRESKQVVMDRLTKSAFDVGANAIIGINLGYAMFGDSILGVFVSGTAVTIVKDE